MTALTTAYVIDAVRTPVGKAPRGCFRTTRPDDLLAHVIRSVLQRQPNVPTNAIQDVIAGCAMPEAEQGMNVARIAALLAGCDNNAPGMTINRFCSSGLQAVALAADQIRTGQADIVLAGGTESMSMVPMGGHKFVANPEYTNIKDENVAIAYGMGITAEFVAKHYQVTREAQEAFALESHRRALAAQKSGEFDAEISPVTVRRDTPDLRLGQVNSSSTVIKQDEGPRSDTTIDAMSKLKPVFAARGSVTAATSSQMSDGAGMLMLASEKAVKDYQLKPMARFVSYAVAGVPPEIMGIGPVKAIPLALQRAGLTLSDIDWIELNEAFAAQALAVINELKLDKALVNPLGGAIALGHPLGATGAIRAATCLHGLQRRKQRYGMVTMCIGTGMGAAGIFEAL